MHILHTVLSVHFNNIDSMLKGEVLRDLTVGNLLFLTLLMTS